MQIRRKICAVLVCILVMGTLAIPASAAENAGDTISPFASAGFEFSISPKWDKEATTDFLLAAGETIEIEATYKPSSASVEFIIVEPDGTLRSLSGTNGSIHKTVRVPESGSYSLVVRNNSNSTVEVTGEVYY